MSRQLFVLLKEASKCKGCGEKMHIFNTVKRLFLKVLGCDMANVIKGYRERICVLKMQTLIGYMKWINDCSYER